MYPLVLNFQYMLPLIGDYRAGDILHMRAFDFAKAS